MFTVYPAIDMRGGRCVRLQQGDFDRQTVYAEDPAGMAALFLHYGASWLHVVDLDGARTGNAQNMEQVRRMVQLGLDVQLGGGVRTLDDVKRRLDMGIKRCIIGTAAIEQPAVVEAACLEYPGQIAVGIDAREGLVAVRGWEKRSRTTALELALRMKDMGVQTIIYTDIDRDGMGTGPNLDDTVKLAEDSGLHVIASGGVSGLCDLRAAKRRGLPGIIMGRAYYDGRIQLKDALALSRPPSV